MIIIGILNIVFELLQVLFSWLSLPDMPVEITSVIDNVIQYVIQGLPLLWLFFDKSLTGICFGLALAIYNFEKIYDFLMWIISKLPIGISKN